MAPAGSPGFRARKNHAFIPLFPVSFGPPCLVTFPGTFCRGPMLAQTSMGWYHAPRGSSASRTASPKRFQPNPKRMMVMAGKKLTYQ
jgi:hypothetical protein